MFAANGGLAGICARLGIILANLQNLVNPPNIKSEEKNDEEDIDYSDYTGFCVSELG
jgi:hypothetical protein